MVCIDPTGEEKEKSQIVVRRAQKDEKFTTLDGQERVLDDTMLMICDGKKPIGIAGIMGGENSEMEWRYDFLQQFAKSGEKNI